MRIALILIAFAACCHSFAERQTVGLALSGGGARGTAHIGVLRVLEEKQIPIDYIAGTSMGAIIGALYSAGYSLDEIEQIVEIIDWQAAFEDDVSREQRAYRRKLDDRRFISKLQFGLDEDGLKLPAGIVSGQSIGLILNRYFAPVSHINQFDKLNIPFRAVATDLATGHAVILNQGSLAEAVTASMSIPGFLIPVEKEGRLLVDGGIANNLPISVVRAMGADIVIAVDISTPLIKSDKLKDVVDVAEQLTSLLTRKNTEAEIKSLKENDVLIVPDLNDITTSDFTRAMEAIPRGVSAAQSSVELSNLAHTFRNTTPRETEQKEKSFWLNLANQKISRISFNNSSFVSTDQIRNRTALKEGDKFSLKAIEQDVNLIYGMGYFNLVQYSLVKSEQGIEVVFHIREKSWGPNYLQLGFNFSSSEDIDNQFNLSTNYLMTNVNELNGEISVGFSVGNDKDLNLSWYQPLDSDWQPFIETEFNLSSDQYNFFEDNSLIAEFSSDSISFDIAAGIELDNWGEIRFGSHYLDGSVEQKIGTPVLNEINYHDAYQYFSIQADTLDSLYFPQDGILLQYTYIESNESIGSQFDYHQNRFRFIKAFDWYQNSIAIGTKYFRTKGSSIPLNAIYRSGGLLNFSGYELDQLSSENAAHAYLVYMRKLELLELLDLFVGLSIERSLAWNSPENFDWSDTIKGSSIFFGADTQLGPFYVAYGKNEESNSFYIMLDKLF